MLLSNGLSTAPLRRALLRRPFLQVVEDALLEERFDQLQHATVRHLLATSAIRRS